MEGKGGPGEVDESSFYVGLDELNANLIFPMYFVKQTLRVSLA